MLTIIIIVSIISDRRSYVNKCYAVMAPIPQPVTPGQLAEKITIYCREKKLTLRETWMQLNNESSNRKGGVWENLAGVEFKNKNSISTYKSHYWRIFIRYKDDIQKILFKSHDNKNKVAEIDKISEKNEITRNDNETTPHSAPASFKFIFPNSSQISNCASQSPTAKNQKKSIPNLLSVTSPNNPDFQCHSSKSYKFDNKNSLCSPLILPPIPDLNISYPNLSSNADTDDSFKFTEVDVNEDFEQTIDCSQDDPNFSSNSSLDTNDNWSFQFPEVDFTEGSEQTIDCSEDDPNFSSNSILDTNDTWSFRFPEINFAEGLQKTIDGFDNNKAENNCENKSKDRKRSSSTTQRNFDTADIITNDNNERAHEESFDSSDQSEVYDQIYCISDPDAIFSNVSYIDNYKVPDRSLIHVQYPKETKRSEGLSAKPMFNPELVFSNVEVIDNIKLPLRSVVYVKVANLMDITSAQPQDLSITKKETFIIPKIFWSQFWQSTKKLKPRDHEQDWHEELNDLFQAVFPICTLTYLDHKCNPTPFRKTTPYFRCTAHCKHSKCASYTFHVFEEIIPPYKDTKCVVTQAGTIIHTGERHRRMVREWRRKTFREQLRGETPYQVESSMIISGKKEQILGGNLNDVIDKQNLQKISSEANTELMVDPDIMIALRKLKILYELS